MNTGLPGHDAGPADQVNWNTHIYRDVCVCQIYEGTSDVQKIIIQRAFA